MSLLSLHHKTRDEWGKLILNFIIGEGLFVTFTYEDKPDLAGIPTAPSFGATKTSARELARQFHRQQGCIGSMVIERGELGNRLHIHCYLSLQAGNPEAWGTFWSIVNDWRRLKGFVKIRRVKNPEDDEGVAQYISKVHLYMSKDVSTAPVWFWSDDDFIDINDHPLADFTPPKRFFLTKDWAFKWFAKYGNDPRIQKRLRAYADKAGMELDDFINQALDPSSMDTLEL